MNWASWQQLPLQVNDLNLLPETPGWCVFHPLGLQNGGSAQRYVHELALCLAFMARTLNTHGFCVRESVLTVPVLPCVVGSH